MTRRQIKQFAQASYKNNQLDEKIVMEIARRLNRKNLKAYIHALKQLEKQKNVFIALPNVNAYNKSEKIFEKIFQNKRIAYQQDPSLLLGTRIQQNDMIYDFSLKKRLHTLAANIEERYE